MNSVVQFVTENWAIIVTVLIVVTNVVNAATNHWSNYEGLKKVALFLTEVTSFLASKDSAKVVKVPGAVQ